MRQSLHVYYGFDPKQYANGINQELAQTHLKLSPGLLETQPNFS